MRKIIFLSVVLIVQLIAPSSWAACSVGKGITFAEQGKYRKAVAQFRECMKDGNPKGHYNLGTMYFKGVGVPKDMYEAIRLFRAAAGMGYGHAQYNLGVMNERGYGNAE